MSLYNGRQRPGLGEVRVIELRPPRQTAAGFYFVVDDKN